MEYPLYKILTQPPLKWGIPVWFFFVNFLIWLIVAVSTDYFFSSFAIGGTLTHVCIAVVLTEHPLFFYSITAYVKSRLGNIKRGTFGAAYYSPIDYSKSLINMKK